MASFGVHPLSTVLFALGYGMALPVLAQIRVVWHRQRRYAMVMHQAGFVLAALGWLLRGRVALAVLHLLGLVIIKIAWSLGPEKKRIDA